MNSASPISGRGSAALIVEGGAMRGIFAAGVLDTWSRADYYPFALCLGVSAGSTALAAYLSGQIGRTHGVITDVSCRKPFISLPRFLGGGHWLDLDWLWPVSLAEYPFDVAEFSRRNTPLLIVTTRVADATPCYHLAEPESMMTVAKASCSVPVAYRNFVLLDGKAHTDGGVADSIPVIEAYRRGARQITVLLSQPWGYRKRPARYPQLLRYLLRQQPVLAEAMLSRHRQYNAALDFIRNPPADCEVRLLAPPPDFKVGRLTRNRQALERGYQQGIAAADCYLQRYAGCSGLAGRENC